MLSKLADYLLFVKYFNTIPYHLSLFSIISYNLTTFFLILHHSPLSYNILPYSSYFDNIYHILTSFYIISHNPTTSLIFRHISPSFSIIRQVDIIFLQYFSTSFFFDNILQQLRQPLFSTKIICHLLSNKKVVVCCIINMLLSLSYYQLNIINILLSLS